MLLLTATTDKLQLVTGSAATVHVHASYVDASQADPPVVQGTSMGRKNTAITTATTTDIVVAPAASETRNVKTLHIRNMHASTATDVTVVYDEDGTDFELHKANLAPGDMLEYVEGIGFFEVQAAATTGVWTNRSTAAQGPGLATDTYVTGSSVPLAGLGTPVVGLTYVCEISASKTAAGTATPIVQVRVGTAGTTADTSRNSFTFSAGTAATDTGRFIVRTTFRSVGSGTSAVLQGHCDLISQPTTGFSSLLKGVQNTSGGFDSTVANSLIGVSINGGTSASWTIQQVLATLELY